MVNKRIVSQLVDFENKDLQALCHLVALDKNVIKDIAQYAIDKPTKIQLVDFLDQIGLPQNIVNFIRKQQDKIIPKERRNFFEKYKRVINTTPSMPHTISIARMNPFTQFENQPPLLFGMGGGSKSLCKGLPIDVLIMVLTAEKLRRELNLGRCRIICANGITYTNIPKNPDFSKKRIDSVLSTERDLLQLVVERFGIADHWDIFLETDIKKIIGPEVKEQYDQMIADADTVPFIGGHHYSIEMAQMWSLLNQETGGVKLGWFIRNLNKKKPEYIMDEQPFDARYVMYLATRGITNKISIPYVKAGVRIFPGATGHIDKDAPYICYNPRDRILLCPIENPAKKLALATQIGGGLKSKFVRRHFGILIRLFEEFILGKELLPVTDSTDEILRTVYRIKRIDDELLEDDERFSANIKLENSRVASRLQFILDYIFEGNRFSAEKLYKKAFPQAVGF